MVTAITKACLDKALAMTATTCIFMRQAVDTVKACFRARYAACQGMLALAVRSMLWWSWALWRVANLLQPVAGGQATAACGTACA